jgi:hypothetical protein
MDDNFELIDKVNTIKKETDNYILTIRTHLLVEPDKFVLKIIEKTINKRTMKTSIKTLLRKEIPFEKLPQNP